LRWTSLTSGKKPKTLKKLESFIKAVNTSDESHLITVPAGPHILSDILLSSPIIVGEGGGGGFGAAAAASAAAAAAAAASGATGGEYDFGVDPSLDPELAMVLRISMEEERARQEEAKRKGEQDTQGGSEAKPTATPAVATTDVEMTSEFDDELEQALAMSMNNGETTSAPASMDLTEDDQIALALQMSSGTPSATSAPAAAPSATAPPSSEQDFLNSVLQSLPGVDMNDARIRNVLQSLQSEKKEESKEDKK